ncbi:hypothetical protein OV203_33920 [Nannocystis sp. ILAH1]|uniref:hypothetical protein n=1 Tax=Nannocystis sp. ILAH1 TaxID=2996789 RepID=UPI00226EB285|nr:hypothetical protein [Nannocystis sp. ILAH1]MCY0990902.1 hypothetical protein [Nannocystis sp. ILAH1]MCY0992185.1 hypothetical protein [Nannocystis sp. ILAH1]
MSDDASNTASTAMFVERRSVEVGKDQTEVRAADARPGLISCTHSAYSSRPPATATGAARRSARNTMSTAKAATDTALEKKVLKKAKAAETSADAIFTILTKNEGTKAPAEAARFLHGLFANGKLGPEHPDAMLALSMPFEGGTAPPDLLAPEMVVGLLQRAQHYSRGLDALCLLAYQQDPARLRDSRASLSEVGRLILDAARARVGEAIEPELARGLIDHFIEKIGAHLPTPEGRIRSVGAQDLLKAVGGIAPAEVWDAAHAEHFAKPRSLGLRPDLLRRFDEPTLVRVLLAVQRLNDSTLLPAFLDLTPRAEPLWAALDAVTDEVRAASVSTAIHFTQSVLACHAALASRREGAEVPASFERLVERLVHGYPMNVAGLDRLAAFCLEAFRALGPARAGAFVELAFARDEARKQRELFPANLVEATLGALASGNAELVATVRQRLPSPEALPPSIGALLQAAG